MGEGKGRINMKKSHLIAILAGLIIIISIISFGLITAFWLWLLFGQENRMFIVLTITYSLIIFISLYGDYKEKELERQKKDWERITGKKYE